jgi:hypothetical protein
VVDDTRAVLVRLPLLVWPDTKEAVLLGLGLGAVIKVPALLNGGKLKPDTGLLLLLHGNDEMIGVEEAVVVTVTVTGGDGGLDAVMV